MEEASDKKKRRYEIAEQFIFQWLPEKNPYRAIIAFTLFSCVIHFIAFYLFQVEYPQPLRPQIRPSQLTILDENSTEAQAFIERIHDRIVFLEPSSKNSISQIKITDHSIRFVPSFAEARPSLKASSVNANDIKYPILDIPIQDTFETWNNRVVFSPNLVKRGVSASTILDDYLDLIPNVPEIKIYLTVPANGTPIVVRGSGEKLSENDVILADAIESTLRFKPNPKTSKPDPGWLVLGSKPKAN